MMKRILVLSLALLIMMTSLLFPAAAVEKTTGEILKSYGIVSGDAMGNLNEETYLTRAEMMVIMSRLMGEFDQASSFTGKSTFKDSSDHWAESYVAYGQSKGWASGLGNNEFGYDQKHTTREAAVFMLRALGYQSDIDFYWWSAFSVAQNLGLVPDHLGADQFIRRIDLFEMIYRTLNTAKKASNLPLIHFIPVSQEALRVVEIRPAGLRGLEIMFSESLKGIGEVLVSASGNGVGVGKIQFSGEDRVYVELRQTLQDGMAYEIKIQGFEGKDGDLSVPRFVTIQYPVVAPAKTSSIATTAAVPLTAYSSVSTTSSTQTELVLEWSGAVKGLRAEHIKYNAAGDSPLGLFLDRELTVPVNPEEAVSKVYALLATKLGAVITGKPLQVGSSEVRLVGSAASGTQLTDVWGNAIEGGSMPVKVDGDGTPPAVTKIELASGSLNTFRVEFSENVTFSTNQVEVRYSTGALIPNLWVSVSGSGKAYTIQLNDVNLSGRSIRLTLRNISDLAFIPNVMASHSATYAFADVERPAVTEVLMDSASKMIYVTYSKPVDVASATSRSRYAVSYSSSALVLSKVPTQLGTTGGSARTFKLSLTNTEYTLAQSSGAQLTVSGVSDLSGNTILTQSFSFAGMTDVSKNPPQLVNVYATDNRSVTAVFNQVLTRVDAGAFKVNLGGVSNVTYSVSGGQTVVKFQTSAPLPSSFSGVSLFIDTTGVSKVQNLYGIDVRNVSKAVEDRR